MPKQSIDVEEWLRKYEQQRGRRTTWDSHWREVDEYFWARSDGFTGQGYGSGDRNGGGEKRTEKIFDVTAPLSMSRGASALAALTTPQHEQWHKLRTTDEELNEDTSVQQWFEQVNKLLFAMRASPSANYYSQVHEGFMSELAFGNHCQFTDESARGGARYRNVHIGQVWIDVDHQGRVDTVYRRLTLSAKAAMQQWGHVWGTEPPAKIKNALEQGKSDLFEFLHVVAPRKNVDPERLGPEAMPWLSLYIFPEDKSLIEEGGFWEFPYQYPRWETSPNEIYGRGPAMTILPLVKVLNSQERTMLRASHLKVEPPILMASDGVFGFGSKTPRFQPGAPLFGMLDSQGRPLAQPFNPGVDLKSDFDVMDAKRNQIQSAFNNDLFRILIETEQMTATEVLERVQEKGQLLSSTIGRMQSEWFGPQIHVELGILSRQGLLPDLPPVMVEAGSEYEIEYVSPITRMERNNELVALRRTFEWAMPFIQLDPKKAELFDYEESVRRHMEVLGGSVKDLRKPEEFAQILDQMAQQEAQAAQAAQMEQMAGTAKDGAQALSVIQGGAQQSAA
jgi:hypothetical protein